MVLLGLRGGPVSSPDGRNRYHMNSKSGECIASFQTYFEVRYIEGHEWRQRYIKYQQMPLFGAILIEDS
jgi:hypothetical protein